MDSLSVQIWSLLTDIDVDLPEEIEEKILDWHSQVVKLEDFSKKIDNAVRQLEKSKERQSDS